MLLTSTFPALSKDDALRELTPCGGDGGRSSSSRSSNGVTDGDVPLIHGHTAGWLSTLPATSNTATTGNSQCSRTSNIDGYASHDAGTTQDLSGTPAATAGEESGGEPSSFFQGGLLATSKAIRRGDVVAVERPLIAAQASQSLPWVVACPGCLRHVGGLDIQLAVAAGMLCRSEAFLVGADQDSATQADQDLATAKAAPSATAGATEEAIVKAAGLEDKNGTSLQAALGDQGEDGEGPGGSGVLPELGGISERFARVRGDFGREGLLLRWRGCGRKLSRSDAGYVFALMRFTCLIYMDSKGAYPVI